MASYSYSDVTTKVVMGLAESIIKSFMGGDESQLDPATGLTIRQKRLITESWGILGSRKNQKKYGVSLFIHLFKSYPDQQNFFPLFKGKPLDELKVSPDMRAHAVTLMYQVGSFVDNLEDPECLVGLLQKVARNHLKRGIGLKEFVELRTMFGPFLEAELGSQATSELKEAWDKLLSVLNSVVKEMEEEPSNKT